MTKTAWIATTAGLALAASLAGTAAHAQQWGGGGYYAAPPYVQHVPPPVQRIWVPGHWEWNGYRQVWVNGYYQVQPLYGQHGGYPRQYRDQDRDGIPNRYDRDRDGDGVPNRFDRDPRNPWRR